LDLRQAAAYLGLSYAETRELVIYGHLPHVRLPNPRDHGRTMRKYLLDPTDLDKFIAEHKETCA
jgi:excisionase family DNA binding protein